LTDEVGIGLSPASSDQRRTPKCSELAGGRRVGRRRRLEHHAAPAPSLSRSKFKIITNGTRPNGAQRGGIVNVGGGVAPRAASCGPAQRHAQRELVLSQPEHRRPEQPPGAKYNNFGGTVGDGRARKVVFFFRRRSAHQSRAGLLTANVTDPYGSPSANANTAPALRDPNAVKLLPLWPAPIAGRAQFVNSQPTINNTRREVGRLDYDINPSWRLTGRYTTTIASPGPAGCSSPSIQVPTSRPPTQRAGRVSRPCCAASSVRRR
jgi:hypothetical protein